MLFWLNYQNMLVVTIHYTHSKHLLLLYNHSNLQCYMYYLQLLIHPILAHIVFWNMYLDIFHLYSTQQVLCMDRNRIFQIVLVLHNLVHLDYFDMFHMIFPYRKIHQTNHILLLMNFLCICH